VAGSGQQDEGGLFADINVTPLVDITLVLLIIFMVAAPLIVNNPSIKVELPKAATGDETPRSTLALTLARDSAGTRLYVNGDRGDERALREVVPTLLKQNAELQAVIAADRGVPYGDVAHIVDLVRSLGIRKFALSMDPAP
jgi:biopolymer transport protein ExbD